MQLKNAKIGQLVIDTTQDYSCPYGLNSSYNGHDHKLCNHNRLGIIIGLVTNTSSSSKTSYFFRGINSDRLLVYWSNNEVKNISSQCVELMFD